MTTDSRARAVPRHRASHAPAGTERDAGAGDGVDAAVGTTGRDRLRARRADDAPATGPVDGSAGPPGPGTDHGPAGGSGSRTSSARALEEAWQRLGDSLFTYCLSVLCDQGEAVAAVRELRQLSARHRRRPRRPELVRAWLYALARHICLLRMEADPVRVRPSGPDNRHSAGQARLARLAWPEAAGVTPSQREALELVGRHGLDTVELAAVLDLRADQAAVLLAQAVCELERTAAALTVLGVADCPELARIGRGRGAVLGTALRGELVRHVDACPTCRGTAERAAAVGPWPGTFRTPGALRLVESPREARKPAAGDRFFAGLGSGRVAQDAAPESVRATVVGHELRFDRRGFPVHRTVRAERATMLRQRAVAGSVIAMVVAAPVVALWATQQDRPAPEEPVSSVQVDSSADASSWPAAPVTGDAGASGSAVPAGPEASVVAASGIGISAAPGIPYAPAPPGWAGPWTGPPSPWAPAPARLDVSAHEVGGRTVVTLTNSGGTAVVWRAATAARWLRLSRDTGTLRPGARFTLLVTVDRAAIPVGPWVARVAIAPSGAMVVLRGPGSGRRGMPPPAGPPASAPAGPPTGPAQSGTPSAPGSPSGGTGSGGTGPTGTPTAAPSSPAPSSSAGQPSGTPPAGDPTASPTASSGAGGPGTVPPSGSPTVSASPD